MAKRTTMEAKLKRGDRLVLPDVTIVFEHTSGTRVRIEADASVRYKIQRAPVLVVVKDREQRS